MKLDSIVTDRFSVDKRGKAWFRVLLLLLGMLVVWPGGQSVAAAPIRLDIWDFPRWLEPGEKTDKFAWLKRQIKEFESTHPDVTIKLTELSWGAGEEKLKIAALGGLYPDLAPGTIPLLFIKEDLIEPIDAYLTPEDRQDYLPAALDAFKLGDKTYGWPWYMGGTLLYMNRGMAASAGVDLPADGRWTPEQFVEIMGRIRTFQGPASSAWPLGIYFQKAKTANFPFAFLYGGDWVDRQLNWRGSDPETLQGLAWIRALVTAGLTPPDAGGRTEEDTWEGFARERRLAAGAFGLWAIKFLQDKLPMDFQIMHYPAPAGKVSPPFLGISGFWVFRRPEQPERVKAAMEFARFLTRSQGQRDLVRYTQFPTRKSAGDIYDANPAMKRAWEVLREGRNVLPDRRWPQIDEEIEIAVQEILGGGSAEPLMKKAGERVSAQLIRSEGSILATMRQGSWLGNLLCWLAPIVLLFVVMSRQTHLYFIVPAVTIIGVFLWYPLADALVLAFRDNSIGSIGGYTWDNFTRALGDPKFIDAVKNTILYTVIVVPVNVFTALVVASLIYGLPTRSKNFFRAMYYLPGVASVVVLTMVWKWLFNNDVGLLNWMLREVGHSGFGWLTDPTVAFFSVMLTGILRSPGGSILIYLAAMGNLPKSLYESAELDGATATQRWWHITVPMLSGTTAFLFVTGAIDALQVFAQVLMLTDGGPGTSTAVVVHRIYTAAFRDFDFGLSTAMSLLLFISILTVTIAQRHVNRGDSMELA